MNEIGFIPKFEVNLFGKPKEDLFLAFGTRFGAGFATAGIPQLEEKLAQELAATVMKVRITILCGAVQADHSFWTGGSVSVKGDVARNTITIASRLLPVLSGGAHGRRRRSGLWQYRRLRMARAAWRLRGQCRELLPRHCRDVCGQVGAVGQVAGDSQGGRRRLKAAAGFAAPADLRHTWAVTPKPKSLDIVLSPLDNERLANFCGPLDENIRQIETAYDVTIARRGEHCRVAGEVAQARLAAKAVQHFYELAKEPLSIDDIQLGLIELRSRTLAAHPSAGLLTRKADLHGRTPHQVQYLRQIQDHDITFGVGPAGTGKTYLAVAAAVDAFERDQVQRIVLTRPAVEAGERLGFLPGDLAQKVDPYLRPLYDALYDLMGFDKVAKMFEKQAIEIAPLAYMRGRTLNHAFVILDEAQNTTPEQMKMFLTRIGIGAKAVVTGDVTQVDLPKGHKCGLIEARRILAGVRGLAFTDFDAADVVRHPLVACIVAAYESHGKEN